MKTVVSLLAVAGLAAAASAQTYESGAASLNFEVWNGSSWASSADVLPGGSVEWRVRVQYTGTRTDLTAMGEMWWQGVFGNVDNTGAGASADQLGAWLGGGTNANGIAGSMVPTADGSNGGALSGYGRVFSFGLAAMQSSNLNILTSFRHSAGANGAPAGEFIRVAGSGSTIWAPDVAATALGTTTANTQSIQRGVQSNQTAQALNPAQWTAGTNVIVFRGAFIASDDTAVRTVSLGSDERFLRRVGGNTSTDNRRYIAWQTGAGDTGTGATGHRTFANAFNGASINIVPTPASIALMGLGGLVAARRRRA